MILVERGLQSSSVMVAGIKLQLLASAPYSGTDPNNTRALGIALERQRGVHAIGSDKRSDFETWPGTLASTPVGVDVFSESPSGGEYLVARWQPEAIGEQVNAASSRRREWLGHRQAVEVALAIRRAMLSGKPDQLRLQEMAVGFVNLDSCSQPSGPKMSRQRYACVLDQIDP